MDRELAMVEVHSTSGKYTEELTHRDYLGALMSLGIERDRIEDIFVSTEGAQILCAASLAGFIAQELGKVRNTFVSGEVKPLPEDLPEPNFEELSVNVASERLDAVVAAVFRLSRTNADKLASQERLAIDGQVVTDGSKKLKPGAKVSVRGFGKFIFDGVAKETKKGRYYVSIRRYI